MTKFVHIYIIIKSMHSKCMLHEITQEKAQSLYIHGSHSSLSILKLSQIIKNELETKLHQTKKIFLQEQSGLSWVQGKIRLDLARHISNENRWLSRFTFNAYKAMQPYNNWCSHTRPFFEGIGSCMGWQYMIGWCIGCASVNSKHRPPSPRPPVPSLLFMGRLSKDLRTKALPPPLS